VVPQARIKTQDIYTEATHQINRQALSPCGMVSTRMKTQDIFIKAIHQTTRQALRPCG